MSAAVTGVVLAGASLGLAGASAAGAFSPGAPPSAASQQQALTQQQISMMPATYQADSIFNPKFAGINSTIAWQNLFGTPATSGTTTANRTGYYDAAGN